MLPAVLPKVVFVHLIVSFSLIICLSQVSENEIEGDEQNDSNSAPEVGLSGVNVN
jgi:hypothetical protein